MERLIRLKEKILKRANGQKTCWLTRYGAYGDMVMITPLLKQLKADGYFVILNCHPLGKIVVTNNPNIDAFIVQGNKEIPENQLEEYWELMAEGIDRFINLSGSIESDLLKAEGSFEFFLSKEDRHRLCNKNYMDHTMKVAGYAIKGAKPQLFFSKMEHEWAKKLIKKLNGKFLVLWSLSGSSPHKVWPYTEYVATEFLENYPNTHVITVGDIACKILEWDHPRTWAWSDNITIRKAMLLTQYADLVIGTETGVLNAASCYDTPKIVMLSHSSEENLTKYWVNAYPVHGNVSCHPCHQLHYTMESCKLNSATKTPLCMTMIRPEQVLLRMEEIYNKARRKVA